MKKRMSLDRIDLEMLRTIGAGAGEAAFAHMCTAALGGEDWALDRLRVVQDRLVREPDVDVLDIVRGADSTRPDGAVARSIQV